MIHRLIAILMVVTVTSVKDRVFSDEPNSSENQFTAKVRLALDAADLKKIELAKELKAMESGRISKLITKDFELTETRAGKKFLWKSADVKTEAIQAMKDRIAKLDSEDSLVPELSYSKLSVGEIGKLPLHTGDVQNLTYKSFQYTVSQVVDGDNALIKWTISSHGYAGELPKSESQMFWLVGSTAGMTDEMVVDSTGVYKVESTKQYASSIGATRTVFQLTKFDASKIIAEIKAEHIDCGTVKKPKIEFREWSDSTGNFRVKAKFTKVDGEVVVLEKESGEQLRVPLAKLSEKDAKWISQQ